MAFKSQPSSSSLQDIVGLSDDDACVQSEPQAASSSNSPAKLELGQCVSTQRGVKRRKQFRDTAPVKAQIREKTLRLLQTKCRCASGGKRESCFQPFRGDEPAVQEIVRLRIRFRLLHKQDVDDEVGMIFKFYFYNRFFYYDISTGKIDLSCCAAEVVRLLTPSALRATQPQLEPDDNRSRSIRFLDKPVCQTGFKQLLALGSSRFRRLWKSALVGKKPPVDGRCRPRESSHAQSGKSQHRQFVVEFLQELYLSLSEPMPEARGPIQGNRKMAFQRRRGRRPRMAAILHRKQDAPAMRLLPPGTFTDYLTMLRTREGCEKISLKLFTTVACFFKSLLSKLFLRSAGGRN